ncbi:hypothetical protein MRB53_037053 [Persea americana]|nr:hypothetical protein MRB53_037053 [Persea americana]
MSMIGVTIAQLFRLQNSGSHDPEFGYFVLGVPLSVIFIVASIIITTCGGWRFYRQQNALTRGKIHAAGYEVYIVGLVVALLSFTLFVLTVAVMIRKDVKGEN